MFLFVFIIVLLVFLHTVFCLIRMVVLFILYVSSDFDVFRVRVFGVRVRILPVFLLRVDDTTAAILDSREPLQLLLLPMLLPMLRLSPCGDRSTSLQMGSGWEFLIYPPVSLKSL